MQVAGPFLQQVWLRLLPNSLQQARLCCGMPLAAGLQPGLRRGTSTSSGRPAAPQTSLGRLQKAPAASQQVSSHHAAMQRLHGFLGRAAKGR